MKQGETITISGEFTGLVNLTGYTIYAMVYCQNAKAGYKKLLFSSASGAENPIQSVGTLGFSFVITSTMSQNMQGECQVEIALQDSNNVAISENYATFAIQNSILGQTLASNGN